MLAGCGTPQAPVTPGVVKVVAAENFRGNIAAQVGDRHARVTSILSSPAADSNLYESDVASAPAVARRGAHTPGYPGAPVAYTERVPGYLMQATGLTVVTPPGFAAAIENGNDPSPGDTALMFRLITSRGAEVPLYHARAVSAVTQQVRALVLEWPETCRDESCRPGCQVRLASLGPVTDVAFTAVRLRCGLVVGGKFAVWPATRTGCVEPSVG